MEFPKRKNIRLNNYNYSQNGAYFLTIASKDKKPLFSDIVLGERDELNIKLTEYGDVVDSALRFLQSQDNNVNIDKYVIMPNHLHILLSVDLPDEVIGKSDKSKETVNKFVWSLKRFTNKKCGAALWQDRFHDHVIRDNNDYLARWKYIDDNPQKWSIAELANPENYGE